MGRQIDRQAASRDNKILVHGVPNGKGSDILKHAIVSFEELVAPLSQGKVLVLVECLSTNRQTKLNIRLNLTCMERPVEQAEFYRSFLKDRMKVQTMITAIIIMCIPPALSVVPDSLYSFHASWLSPI